MQFFWRKLCQVNNRYRTAARARNLDPLAPTGQPGKHELLGFEVTRDPLGFLALHGPLDHLCPDGGQHVGPAARKLVGEVLHQRVDVDIQSGRDVVLGMRGEDLCQRPYLPPLLVGRLKWPVAPLARLGSAPVDLFKALCGLVHGL